MYKFNLRRFFGWKLLLIMAFLAAVFHFVLMLFKWYFLEAPILFTLDSLFELIITYVNLLFVAAILFFIVKWLNKKIKWSVKTALLRTIIDFIVFSIITLGWIIIVNQAIFYLREGTVLSHRQIVFLIAVGLIVNLFLVPVIELMALMNIQYQSELNNKHLLHENAKFRYEILKNQINPHFLFNSLSVLNSLIGGNSPDKAKLYVNSFSSVLRHVLDFKDSNVIELNAEKKFLENYIFLLKTRFGDVFDANIVFGNAYSKKKILPMVLQLLVENVVKHNIMSDKEPMVVDIQTQEKGIVVSNVIRKKSSVGSWGIGLENIEMRYASLGYKVEIDDSGEIFKVFVPYIE